MDALQIVVLTAVSMCAGAINAVAGGGTLLSFPALMAAGFDAKVANITNTVAIWPGSVGGSLAYRQELGERKRRLWLLFAPSVLGALVGALLLLSTPQSAFNAVVPFLIYFACGLLAAQSRLMQLTQSMRFISADVTQVPIVAHLSIFAIAVYGGYFGAGIGIMMLAVLSVVAPDTLHHSNALKGMLALVINFVALVCFAILAPVAWSVAAFMAVGSVAGGYFGVRVARHWDPRILRWLIVGYGLVVATVLLLR